MRKFGMLLCVVVALVFVSCNSNNRVKIVGSGLCFCEAVYNMNDTLLIANFGGSQLNPLNTTTPNGYIMQYSNDTLTPFLLDTHRMLSPKGMVRVGDFLYIADVCRVHAVNLATPNREIITVPLSSFESFANHFAVVGDMLLLSSTSSDKILALKLQSNGAPHYSGFQIYMRVPGPNGLLYDNGCLYIASYNVSGTPSDDNVIYVVDDFSRPNPRPFISRVGQYDGLAVKDGSLYFSDWVDGVVGKVSLENPEKIELIDLSLELPLSGPAQIDFYDGYLCIPDLPNSRVVMLKE